jgi:hypothetical protein
MPACVSPLIPVHARLREVPVYPGVELRLYRYVVMLAEVLNFTRAAARLHVAQPALSNGQVREAESLASCRSWRDRHLKYCILPRVCEAEIATPFHRVPAGPIWNSGQSLACSAMLLRLRNSWPFMTHRGWSSLQTNRLRA